MISKGYWTAALISAQAHIPTQPFPQKYFHGLQGKYICTFATSESMFIGLTNISAPYFLACSVTDSEDAKKSIKGNIDYIIINKMYILQSYLDTLHPN